MPIRRRSTMILREIFLGGTESPEKLSGMYVIIQLETKTQIRDSKKPIAQIMPTEVSSMAPDVHRE